MGPFRPPPAASPQEQWPVQTAPQPGEWASSSHLPGPPHTPGGRAWHRGPPREPDSVPLPWPKAFVSPALLESHTAPPTGWVTLGLPGQGAPSGAPPPARLPAGPAAEPLSMLLSPRARESMSHRSQGRQEEQPDSRRRSVGQREAWGSPGGGHCGTPSGAAPASRSGPEPARVSPRPRCPGLLWVAPSWASARPAAQPPRHSALGGRGTCRAGRGGSSGAVAQALPGPPWSLTTQGPAAAPSLAQQGRQARPRGEATAPGPSSDPAPTSGGRPGGTM